MQVLSMVLLAASVTIAPFAVHADVSPVRTSVEVDTSQVGESGPVIQRRVRERSDVILRRDGVLPARPGQDPVVWVTVYELRDEEPGYAFELRAQRGDDDLLHTERFECRLCTETELVGEVEIRLDSLVGKLGAQTESTRDATSEDEPVLTEPPPPHVDSVPLERDAGLGAMGKVGIAGLATGVVGLGVGIGLASKKDVPQRDARNVTTTKPPGYALIGIGAGLAIAGAVLLAIDRKRASRTTAFAPWVGPAGAGLTVGGRF
jgi:hypothetical protein